MLSAVNKLTFILSRVSLSPSVPPFPCNEPCQERSGVALIGQEGTGWAGHSSLGGKGLLAACSAFSANLEMSWLRFGFMTPHSFPLCSGEDPRSLLESCSAEWCSVFTSASFWVHSFISSEQFQLCLHPLPWSPKIMNIKHFTWGPYPEAAELFSNFGLVWTSCLFFLSKELESLCLGSSWSLPN